MSDQFPTPLTDLRRRAPVARKLISAMFSELVGAVELVYDFYREWNGCWKVRASGSSRRKASATAKPGNRCPPVPPPAKT